MAHTVSPRKRRERVLASPIGGWRGWMLAIDCGAPRCPRGRRYLMADLVRVWPGETVATLLRRLVCRGCGGGVADATLIRDRPFRPREPETIPLLGRGAAG